MVFLSSTASCSTSAHSSGISGMVEETDFLILVNYHKLNAANLNKLIYTYLGEWIRTQRSAEESGTPGASARLVAALELQRETRIHT